MNRFTERYRLWASEGYIEGGVEEEEFGLEEEERM
jgi:hypothetical protein